MSHNRKEWLRGFTLIELLVVIGLLSFIGSLTALLTPVLRTADRMQERESLFELGVELSQATEDVRVASVEARAVVVWSLAGRRINRDGAAQIVRQVETINSHLFDLLRRMEELKPRLCNELDRQRLGDAIQATRKLTAAAQQLIAALERLVMLEMVLGSRIE